MSPRIQIHVFKRDVDNAEAYLPPGTYLVLAMNNQVLIRLQAGIPRGMARMSVAPPKTGKCTALTALSMVKLRRLSTLLRAKIGNSVSRTSM